MSSSVEPRPTAPDRRQELVSVVLATLLSVLALVYLFTTLTAVLVAWEVAALTYLIFVATKLKNRTTRNAPAAARALSSALLEPLSWALPIAASMTGATSAVVLLTVGDAGEPGGLSGPVIGVLGSGGVVVAWLLLQTGFAEVYESVYERLPDPSMIDFPDSDGQPVLSDFLYLSFAIGTSFAVSGATIGSRKVRRVILLHSIASFFYNAVLIAIAIQVVQTIVTNT